MTAPYRPIDCALHDELQLRALRRTVVSLSFREEGRGGVRSVSGRLVDVRTRNGAEYLSLESGAEIRLDLLVEVDGIPFGHAC